MVEAKRIMIDINSTFGIRQWIKYITNAIVIFIRGNLIEHDDDHHGGGY